MRGTEGDGGGAEGDGLMTSSIATSQPPTAATYLAVYDRAKFDLWSTTLFSSVQTLSYACLFPAVAVGCEEGRELGLGGV